MQALPKSFRRDHKSRGLSCVYACKKITYARSSCYSLCQSSVDYANIKITQHALKVSVFIMLKLDVTGMKKEKKCQHHE